MRLALACIALCSGALGCDSNPTPHPQNDAAVDSREVNGEPGEDDKGPDLDGDGVPDCAAAGGYWDGRGCTDAPTGLVDAGEVEGGDASADGGDVGPDAADDGGDAGDAGDAGDGGEVAD